MDTGYISALSALAGSSIGAFATFATTWLNQSYQAKILRHSNERARREKLFGEFINEAALAYSDSMINKLENPSALVNLYSLKSRIKLFSNDEVIEEADKVIRTVIDMYYRDKIPFSEMGLNHATQFDLLRDFTASCKREMMNF
jgi:hypothetical protein